MGSDGPAHQGGTVDLGAGQADFRKLGLRHAAQLAIAGLDGLAVCRALRAESTVPIVMLTARGDTLDIVEGLQAGADDYIVKPFKPKELVARIQARLRRLEETAHEVLTIGDLVMAALGAGLTLEAVDERAPDADFAARYPRAKKYVDWPMLVVLRLAG